MPSWTARPEQKHDICQEHFSLKTTGSLADKPSDVVSAALESFSWSRRPNAISCYNVEELFDTPNSPTFVRQCDSLHGRDRLPIFQLQDTGVVPSRCGGDGLQQGRGYAAESADLVQLTTLILVLPGGLLDLGSL